MPRGTSRYDEAQLQGRLWTPKLLSGSIGCWLDAADLTTISVATGVSQWTDKGPNALHGTQATGSAQPAFLPTGLNRRPCLSFSAASSQFLAIPTIQFIGWTSLQGFYVWQRPTDPPPATAGSATPVSWMSDTGTPEHEPWTDGNVYVGFGSTARKTISDSAHLFSSPRITGVSSVASDWRYYVDGVSLFTTATSTVGLSAAPLIGKTCLSAPVYFDGQIGELIVLNRASTSFEREKTEGYLAWKWGIVGNLAASHPYKNRPPTIGG